MSNFPLPDDPSRPPPPSSPQPGPYIPPPPSPQVPGPGSYSTPIPPPPPGFPPSDGGFPPSDGGFPPSGGGFPPSGGGFQSPYQGLPAGQPAKNSAKAIAALVVGIVSLLLCFLVVPALVALVLGILGLREIGRSGGQLKGKGMAIAGIVTGGIGLLLGAFFIVGLAVGGDSDSSSDSAADGVNREANDLEVGDCVTLPSGEIVTDVLVVDCDSPHEGEVYAVEQLAESTYPGDEQITGDVIQECVNLFEDYTSDRLEGSGLDVYYMYPREQNWSQGDRTFVCVAYDVSGDDLTDSLAA